MMTPVMDNNSASKRETRRVSKPLMEKRRRARINHSLAELKSLLLDASEKENPRNSKLEKADILEMAVRHLQELHRQHRTVTLMNDPYLKDKFRAGFEECIQEVDQYLQQRLEVKEPDKQRLLGFLNRRLRDVKDLNADSLWTQSSAAIPSAVVLVQKPSSKHCQNADSTKLTNSSNFCNCNPTNSSTSGSLSDCHSAIEKDVNNVPDRVNSASNISEPCRNTNCHISKDNDFATSCGDCSDPEFTELMLIPKRLSTGELILVLPHCVTRNKANRCFGIPSSLNETEPSAQPDPEQHDSSSANSITSDDVPISNASEANANPTTAVPVEDALHCSTSVTSCASLSGSESSFSPVISDLSDFSSDDSSFKTIPPSTGSSNHYSELHPSNSVSGVQNVNQVITHSEFVWRPW